MSDFGEPELFDGRAGLLAHVRQESRSNAVHVVGRAVIIAYSLAGAPVKKPSSECIGPARMGAPSAAEQSVNHLA